MVKKVLTKPKLYFLAIAPLLLATALIRVECPVCCGTGCVEGSIGMEKIRVISTESRILDTIQDACTGYIVTKAHPIISFFNLGTEAAIGWLTVNLVNTDSGENLAQQYIPVTIDGNTTIVLDSNVVFAFYSADIPPENLDIVTEPLTGTVSDPVCNGSGRIGINTYFLAQQFKDRLVSAVKSEQEFGPDLSHGEPGSKEYMDWWELD